MLQFWSQSSVLILFCSFGPVLHFWFRALQFWFPASVVVPCFSLRTDPPVGFLCFSSSAILQFWSMLQFSLLWCVGSEGGFWGGMAAPPQSWCGLKGTDWRLWLNHGIFTPLVTCGVAGLLGYVSVRLGSFFSLWCVMLVAPFGVFACLGLCFVVRVWAIMRCPVFLGWFSHDCVCFPAVVPSLRCAFHLRTSF